MTAPVLPRQVRSVCVFGSPWPGGLGDCILFNIFLALLRRACPQAEITYVVGVEQAGRLLSGGHLYADRVITCPGSYDEDPQWWRKLIAEVAAQGCDCCVFDPVSSGLLIEQAAACGIKIRVGIVNGGPSDRFMTVPVLVSPPGEHGGSDLLDYAQALACSLGLGPLGRAEVVPPFPYQPQPVPSLPRPLIAVHPGGAPGWNRRWPIARYGQLCRELTDAGGPSFVLVGSADEKSDLAHLRDEILSAAPRARVEVSAGEPINRLASWLAQADVLVGNDSAPAHIAAALRTATVVLYGPSPNEFWWRRAYDRHRGVNHHRVCQNEEQAFGSDTAPCRFACQYRYSGAAGPYPRCLTDISVAEVLRTVRRQLSGAGRPAENGPAGV